MTFDPQYQTWRCLLQKCFTQLLEVWQSFCSQIENPKNTNRYQALAHCYTGGKPNSESWLLSQIVMGVSFIAFVSWFYGDGIWMVIAICVNGTELYRWHLSYCIYCRKQTEMFSYFAIYVHCDVAGSWLFFPWETRFHVHCIDNNWWLLMAIF